MAQERAVHHHHLHHHDSSHDEFNHVPYATQGRPRTKRRMNRKTVGQSLVRFEFFEIRRIRHEEHEKKKSKLPWKRCNHLSEQTRWNEVDPFILNERTGNDVWCHALRKTSCRLAGTLAYHNWFAARPPAQARVNEWKKHGCHNTLRGDRLRRFASIHSALEDTKSSCKRLDRLADRCTSNRFS